MTRLQFCLAGSTQVNWKRKQLFPAIVFSFRYHFLRAVLSYTAYSFSLGSRLVATFQSRSLKLDFLGGVTILMLPSLGGNNTNPVLLTTVKFLPAASPAFSKRQLCQGLHFSPLAIWVTVKLQQVCSKHSLTYWLSALGAEQDTLKPFILSLHHQNVSLLYFVIFIFF